MEKATSQKPVIQLYAGTLTLSVFQNENEKNGKNFQTYSISLQKSYEDKAGRRAFTNYLSPNDLLVGASLMDKAYWEISILRKK